ncbi:hypothetical protein IWQ61_005003 [Dispira simplex]|nr:hypothetical protein IWQ61_005003 [Dispira simplex]
MKMNETSRLAKSTKRGPQPEFLALKVSLSKVLEATRLEKALGLEIVCSYSGDTVICAMFIDRTHSLIPVRELNTTHCPVTRAALMCLANMRYYFTSPVVSNNLLRMLRANESYWKILHQQYDEDRIRWLFVRNPGLGDPMQSLTADVKPNFESPVI